MKVIEYGRNWVLPAEVGQEGKGQNILAIQKVLREFGTPEQD